MNNALRCVLSLSVLLLSVSAYAQSNDVLNRMGVIAKMLNYDGVFSYQEGKNLQSVRIIHRSTGLGEVERLVSLTGVAREVIRTNDSVKCIYPEGESMQDNHQSLGRGFPTDFLSKLTAAAAYYNVVSGKQGRVAAHHTQELMVIPVDPYRYGYQLWVDKENKLLLESNLLEATGTILETFSFSSVKIGEPITDELLQATLKGNEMSWRLDDQTLRTTKKLARKNSPWHVTWLPAGFKLVIHQNRFKARNGVSIEQQVYSDGLSSVSVFIEKMRAKHSHLHGSSHRGATYAFGTIMAGHFVTVVGKVPAKTVEKVGESIRYNKEQ